MLKQLGNRVIVEVAKEEEKSIGGIVLPSSAKEKSQTGTVIAVGAGRVTDNGVTIEMIVKAGDTVLSGKYAGTEVKYAGTEYLVIKESDIVAILD